MFGSGRQEHRKLAEDLGQHGALRAVATLERVPAADVRALSELYRHLEASVTAARQAPEEDDVALDAAAFLQTLHVPVPVPKVRPCLRCLAAETRAHADVDFVQITSMQKEVALTGEGCALSTHTEGSRLGEPNS